MKVALVHDWLTGMRGGEKCLDVFCELFPRATLFTLVHTPGALSPRIEAMEIRTSFIDRLPGARTRHQRWLPLFPAAIERFDFGAYDFILSTSHCVAKGARARAGALHVCYCHTPMRYVWEFFDEYFRGPGAGWGARAVMPFVAPGLRRWDVASAARVDRFVANSAHVRERIRRIYGRDADVIHPPVDTERFHPAGRARPARDGGASAEAPYLVVSKLVPYKRVEIAVLAANRLRVPLRVVGDGPERPRLERLAGPTVRFEGWLPDEALARAYRESRALLFPGVEDFGIVPLEAQACGTPVVALAAGGALETVVDGVTGLLFSPQTDAALAAALERFDASRFDPRALRAHAERFARPRFREAIRDYLAPLIGAEAMAAGEGRPASEPAALGGLGS